MSFERLVVNGCSYMAHYATGQGHTKLAQKLDIPTAENLSLPGSCNSRIIRTCLQDSYKTTQSTLYVIGLTFLSRIEIPVSLTEHPVEGKWISLQNQVNYNQTYEAHWTHKDTKQLLELNLKLDLSSTRDRFENLIYNLLSLVDSLHSRGHSALIYKQVNDVHTDIIDQTLALSYCSNTNFVHRLNWHANIWQFNQGVKWAPKDELLPLDARHPQIGDNIALTEFLSDYIKNVSV